MLLEHRNYALKNGFNVLIIGKPNVGKSTLMNAIIDQEVSIVTDIPGTTRDVIEKKIDLNGYPVYFSDTAGVRNTSSKIEKEGIKKTYDYIKKRGTRPFDYNIKIEIDNELTPTTWKNKEI